MTFVSSATAARRARLDTSGPLIALCVAVVVLGSSPVMTRSVTAPAAAIVVVRLWTSLPLWYLVMRLSGGRTTGEIWRAAFPLGVLFGASMSVSIQSFKDTSIANATLIPSMQPVVIMLVAARIYGERRSGRDYLLGVLAMAGVVAVVLGAGQTSGASRRGDLEALSNLFIFAAYLLRLKHVRSAGIPTMPYLMCMMTWAAIAATPWALTSAGSSGLAQVDGWDWALIGAMNLLSAVIGHGLLTWAQAGLAVTTTALMQLAGPVVSMIGAWWVHGQTLQPVQFLGGAVVLGALAAIIEGSRRPAPA